MEAFLKRWGWKIYPHIVQGTCTAGKLLAKSQKLYNEVNDDNLPTAHACKRLNNIVWMEIPCISGKYTPRGQVINLLKKNHSARSRLPILELLTIEAL